MKGGLRKAGLVGSFALLWCGCVNTPVDPTDRYVGNVEPCEVVYDGSHAEYDGTGLPADHPDAYATDPPSFWLPGPYPTWNTTPATQCGMDPTIPFVATETIEKNGEVEEFDHENVRMYMTYPARSVPTVTGDGRVADGRFPVIVWAHANNDRQCNIYRGYYSLHDHWASWGYVVVAIDGTDLNCKRGTKQNLQLRSESQLAAIERLRELDADPDSIFHGRLDMDRVILAGHSRGAGASILSQREYDDSVAIMFFQGVDTTAFGFGSAPVPDVPFIGFTAGEDVDLNYPHVEPTEDQLSGEYTWVNVTGGTHAYTADGAPDEPDDQPLISREQQHDIQEYFSTAFLARVVGVPIGTGGTFARLDAADRVLFSHEGTRVVADEISPLAVFHRWLSPADALWVDDFDSNIADNPTDLNLLGGGNRAEGFAAAAEVATYKPEENPRTGAYGKAWSLRLEGAGVYTTGIEGEDVSTYDHLVFRVKGPDKGDPSSLAVTLDGSDPVDIDDFRGPVDLENRMDQVVIPLAEFDVDLTEVDELQLETSDGTIFIDDIRFSKDSP